MVSIALIPVVDLNVKYIPDALMNCRSECQGYTGCVDERLPCVQISQGLFIYLENALSPDKTLGNNTFPIPLRVL